MKIQVACAQFQPLLGRTTFNLRAMAKWVNRIKSEHFETQLIIFPELSISGYECGNEFNSLAETIDGPSIHYMQNVAYRYHVHLIFGFAERDQLDPGVIYNSAMLISDTGQIIALTGRFIYLIPSKRISPLVTTIPYLRRRLAELG